MNKMIVVGLAIAFVVGILAPFLASTNPDGLESAAEKIIRPGVEEGAVFESPMPDYIIPSLGESPISGVVAIVIGVLIIFGLSYGVGLALKKKRA